MLAERKARTSLPDAEPGMPNVLLIVMDDVRADALSVYGYSRDTTPNLARIVRRAIRSTRPGPRRGGRSHRMQVCSRDAGPMSCRRPSIVPSTRRSRPWANTCRNRAMTPRASWATRSTAMRGMAWIAASPTTKISTRIDAYRASSLAVLDTRSTARRDGLARDRDARRQGLAQDRGDDQSRCPWLALPTTGRPPVLRFLNYYAGHAPFQPPDGFGCRFGLSALPLAERESILRNYSRLMLPNSPTRDAAALISRSTPASPRLYDSCIASLDDQLGRLFNELERRGLLANTLVILTSDHGEHFNDHNLVGHGNSLYRPLLHVPLLLIPPWNEDPSVRVVREPASLRDLPATVVDLLGLARDRHSRAGLSPGTGTPIPGDRAPRRRMNRSWPKSSISHASHETRSSQPRWDRSSRSCSINEFISAIVTAARNYTTSNAIHPRPTTSPAPLVSRPSSNDFERPWRASSKTKSLHARGKVLGFLVGSAVRTLFRAGRRWSAQRTLQDTPRLQEAIPGLDGSIVLCQWQTDLESSPAAGGAGDADLAPLDVDGFSDDGKPATAATPLGGIAVIKDGRRRLAAGIPGPLSPIPIQTVVPSSRAEKVIRGVSRVRRRLRGHFSAG